MNVEHCRQDHPLRFNEGDYQPSTLCRACGLPVFSTPYYTCSSWCDFLLHQKCAFLPKKLKHLLHQQHTLTLVTDPPVDNRILSCEICKREPDDYFFYLCDVEGCFYFLHLLCACPLEIKILHRSHQHELTPLPAESCFHCGACGNKHEGRLSYFCQICGYWLHRDCSSLPDIIWYTKHSDKYHPLPLTYDADGVAAVGPASQSNSCASCDKAITSSGAYVCGRCEYYAHINCATAHPHLYKPASNVDIYLDFEVIDLPEELQTMMWYLLRDKSINITDSMHVHVHDHPLIFHDAEDDDDDDDDVDEQLLRQCDGCAQPIFPVNPYYSCSHSDCSNFFLHSCCANVPPTYQHRAHEKHPLSLFKRPPSDKLLSQFICRGCNSECNGFAYGCEHCSFFLDTVCAFLPRTIKYEGHADGCHYLNLNDTNSNHKELDCCTNSKSPWLYSCTLCTGFRIHVDCAFMPSFIKREFHPHYLRLQTYSGSDEDFCEICEEKIDGKSRKWQFHCRQCNQWFHSHCIPSANVALSRIKFGRSIRLPCHDCPVTCIRLPAIGSYLCGYCRKCISVPDGQIHKELKDCIAFECSKCCFWIHYTCAESLSHHV